MSSVCESKMAQLVARFHQEMGIAVPEFSIET